MGEGKVAANGIEIWYEDFGNPGSEASYSKGSGPRNALGNTP